MNVDPKTEAAISRELEEQCIRLAVARGWVRAPPLRVSGDDVVARFPFEAQRVQLSSAIIRADPPQREYMLRDVNTGAGVYVRGKVGLLAATGGTGKTWVGMQLAVAQATGVTWFGSGGWAPVNPGPVLFLLAEEDKGECVRMLHFACRAAHLNEEQYDLLAKNLDVVALPGASVALTNSGFRTTEGLPETDVAIQVRSYLRDSKLEGRPYTLVLFDPLSRFEGPDVEKDPVAGTRFVQVIETFTTEECGRPSAIISCHTRKRGIGDDRELSADSIRGTTAIKDAVRWAATLEQQKRGEGIADLITLKIQKANGVPPQLTPLVLCRDQQFEGTLRVASPGELESNEELADKLRSRVQEADDHRSRVLELIGERPDPPWSRNALARICGKKTLVLEAVRQLLASGELFEPSPGRLSIPREPVGTGKGTGSGNAAAVGGSPPPTAPFRGAEGREPQRLGDETGGVPNGVGTTSGTTPQTEREPEGNHHAGTT